MNKLFSLTLACALVSACGKAEESKSAATEKANSPEQEFKEAAMKGLKAQLAARLKDPGSVEFRNVEYYEMRVTLPSGKTVPMVEAICGQFNAKNSYGGYVGFTDFVSKFSISQTGGGIVEDSEEILMNNDSDGEAMRMWYVVAAPLQCKNMIFGSTEELLVAQSEMTDTIKKKVQKSLLGY